jgi:hypothetical protein
MGIGHIKSGPPIPIKPATKAFNPTKNAYKSLFIHKENDVHKFFFKKLLKMRYN